MSVKFVAELLIRVAGGLLLGYLAFYCQTFSSKMRYAGIPAEIYMVGGVVFLTLTWRVPKKDSKEPLPNIGPEIPVRVSASSAPTGTAKPRPEVYPPELTGVPKNVRSYMGLIGQDHELITWWERAHTDRFVVITWSRSRKKYLVGYFPDYPDKQWLDGGRVLGASDPLFSILSREFAATPQALERVKKHFFTGGIT